MISFEELISNTENYTILGKDKCGKTSLLKRIQLEYLINYSRNGRIPFFSTQKSLNRNSTQVLIWSYISETILK